MQDLRTLFEGKYPGKERLFEALIKPIFSKATDTSLTDEQVLVDSDRGQIKSCSIIAQVRGGFPIIFADVELQDTVNLKRSRVNIQNCVRRIMENNTNAIIFFHFTDNAKEWRVSYVHRAGTNGNSTSAKRHTYLCGPEHSCRTVSERFETLKGLATIKDEDMAEAFSVEPLSKEFFDAYKTFYEDFVQYITGSRYVKVGGKYERKVVDKENAEIFGQFKEHAGGDYDLACKLVRDYVKKLMGRLVFLHFLQKKGWLGVKAGSAWGSGDRNFIQNLFANADDGVKDDFLSRALEPLFFRTLNTDRGKAALAPEEISAVYGGSVRIPYLNGGLFEEDELDKKRVRFRREDFKNLLDFFSRYNFTIDEGDPTDKEIGIDPEMLGKIFENLLEDNKDKGAFYTPKEIVQYMCRESLCAYLCADGDADAGAVRRIMERGDAEGMGEGEKSALLGRLHAVKVCDPAVGSGAFPMGMMNELFALRTALGDTEEPSEIKKQIVRDNIYGVDIEKGAVDIARLRFWLAIIVDEQEPIPLPNLDYKIMRGNSLLESYTYKIRSGNNDKEITVDLSRMLAKPDDGSLDYNEESRNLLKTNIDGYFDPGSHEHKQTKNDVIKACVFDLACSTCGLKPNSEPALALHEKIWNGTDDFFLWHTWFGDVFNGKDGQGGFDIVIGNPPYKIVSKGDKFKDLYNNLYIVAHGGKRNLYHLFFEKGIGLLKQNGVLSYISPDTYFSGNDTETLRKYLVEHTNIKSIVHYTEKDKVFENVTQAVAVIVLLKQRHRIGFPIILSDSVEKIEYKNLTEENKFVFKGSDCVIEKMRACKLVFGDVCEGYQGEVNLTQKKEFIFDKYTKNTLPLVRGVKITKYNYEQGVEYCSLRAVSRNHANMQRIVFQEVANMGLRQRLKGTILQDVICGHSTNYIFSKDENKNDNRFVLGVLNSTAVNYYFKFFNQTNHVPIGELKRIPFPSATAAQQKPVIVLVDKILAKKRKDSAADTSALEAQIDGLVYALYGLTAEEIAVVEGR